MVKNFILGLIIISILSVISPSCRRRATCPAYGDTQTIDDQIAKEQKRIDKRNRRRGGRKKARMF